LGVRRGFDADLSVAGTAFGGAFSEERAAPKAVAL
jgi:hypothetical protein